MDLKQKINAIPETVIFDYKSLGIPIAGRKHAYRVMAVLVVQGVVKRVPGLQGAFYRPEQSQFGELGPESREWERYFLFDSRGKRIGYLTGAVLLNRMGLSFQVPWIIEITRLRKRKPFQILNPKIRFEFRVARAKEITEKNYSALQVLDCIEFFTIHGFRSPDDIDVRTAMVSILEELGDKEIQTVKECSVWYPAAVQDALSQVGNNASRSS